MRYLKPSIESIERAQRHLRRLPRAGVVLAALALPVGAVPTAAGVVLGAGLRAAASKVVRIVQGEAEPSLVNDRSASALDNPPPPKKQVAPKHDVEAAAAAAH